MKRIITFVLIPFLCFNLLNGQSLSESLGGIRTNFRFLSDTVNLNVTDQIIILGAEKKTHMSFNDDGGWGYGYQSFHLEFISSKELTIKEELGKKTNDYQLTFSDKNKKILATIQIPEYNIRMCTSNYFNDREKFYSIDLINIPVLLLERASDINIIKLR